MRGKGRKLLFDTHWVICSHKILWLKFNTQCFHHLSVKCFIFFSLGSCSCLIKPLPGILIFLLPHQVLLPMGLKGRVAMLLLLLTLCSTDLITHTVWQNILPSPFSQLRFLSKLLDDLPYYLIFFFIFFFFINSALDVSLMIKVRPEQNFSRQHLWTVLHNKIPRAVFWDFSFLYPWTASSVLPLLLPAVELGFLNMWMQLDS